MKQLKPQKKNPAKRNLRREMRRAGHVPLRRCVGCRRVRPQAELVRFALGADGPQLDLAGRGGGRGAWVCRDTPACWTPKRLGRSFRAHTDAVCRTLREHADAITPPHDQTTTRPNQAKPDQVEQTGQTKNQASQTGGLHV